MSYLGRLDSLSHSALFRLQLRSRLRQLSTEALGSNILAICLSLQGISLGAYPSEPLLQPLCLLHQGGDFPLGCG
jgi:hypothetical protein